MRDQALSTAGTCNTLLYLTTDIVSDLLLTSTSSYPLATKLTPIYQCSGRTGLQLSELCLDAAEVA